MTPLPFKQANVAAMQKKIQEHDDAIKALDAAASLTAEEGSNLMEIFGMLSTANSALLTEQHVVLVAGIIDRWPAAQAFPGAYVTYPHGKRLI